MLTPQELSEREFTKAVFGGYDMSGVDEFIESVAADYSTLYKENAILKSKLKVLVDKVEEYRSTEDAMRMALLTAQTMGDEIIADANKKRDQLLAEAEDIAKNKVASIRNELTAEQERLRLAKEETAKYVRSVRELMGEQEKYLIKLSKMSKAYSVEDAAKVPAPAVEKAPEKAPAPAAKPIVQEPAPAPVVEVAPAPAPQPEVKPEPVVEAKPEPVVEPAPSTITVPAVETASDEEIAPVSSGRLADIFDEKEERIMDAAMEIDKAVSSITESTPDYRAIFDDEEPEKPFTRRLKYDDEDEPTSPRPKFNFDDLQFGSNYDTGRIKK